MCTSKLFLYCCPSDSFKWNCYSTYHERRKLANGMKFSYIIFLNSSFPRKFFKPLLSIHETSMICFNFQVDWPKIMRDYHKTLILNAKKSSKRSMKSLPMGETLWMVWKIPVVTYKFWRILKRIFLDFCLH